MAVERIPTVQHVHRGGRFMTPSKASGRMCDLDHTCFPYAPLTRAGAYLPTRGVCQLIVGKPWIESLLSRL